MMDLRNLIARSGGLGNSYWFSDKGLRLGFALCLIALVDGAATLSAAGDRWGPTVATTAGQDVAQRVAEAGYPKAAQVTDSLEQVTKKKKASAKARRRVRSKAQVAARRAAAKARADAALQASSANDRSSDASYAAPSLMTLQHAPLPGGQWSTIVTGGIGGQRLPRPNAARTLEPVAQQAPGTPGPAGPPGPVGARTPAVAATAPAARVPTPAQTRPSPPDASPGARRAAPPKPNAARFPRRKVARPPAAAAPPASTKAVAPAASVTKPVTAKPPGEVPATAVRTAAKPLESLPPNATPAEQYCFNTVDTAADARYAWQAKKIKEMEGELAKRVELLEAKTEEFKKWLARRDDFSERANDKLVGFYARMRPDAAALQLAAMNEETAAAVLMKLATKTASAVMGEMDTAHAARLAAIISGAGRLPKKAEKKAAPSAASKPKANGSAAKSAAGKKS
jgi:flagellar motility protein MotE (MotC chaperone)